TKIDGLNDPGVGNSGAGIRATSTSGNITVTTSGGATIGNFAGTNLDYGILATTTSGAITISNTANVGNNGTAPNGVDVAGISATIGSGTANLSITNSGALHVDHAPGNVSVVTNAGIYASNGGTGNVIVVNSGVIDPPSYGIFATG